MFTKFFLRSSSCLPITLSPPLTPFFSNPCTPTSIRPIAVVSASASLSVTLDETFPYEPSLSKGYQPSIQSKTLQQDNEDLFDENCFTRVFDISALRVSADRCYALESQIRGHLLNWPRIRNIARVPGDEIDGQLQKYFNSSDDEPLESLNRRIYGKAEGDGEPLSPVLYRDKLAKTFNARGYEKFRNLAKLSRPKRKTKKEPSEIRENKRNECYQVEEVVDDRRSAEEKWEDLSGLIGEAEYRLGKWKGSTRLLLLDHRHADKSMDELPEAIKACLTGSPFELVRCKLTLFYNYWQMNEILEALLPKGMIVPSSFETVGHIIHLNLRDEHLPYKNLIAKVVLDKNRPKIQTVVNKIDSIDNEFRTMQLEVLAGNHSLVTRIVENGVHFHVDLAAVYWSSKLATERQRLVNCFTRADVVCDVFAGVGPLAISAAKKVKYVYANDLNPHAIDYLERNCVLNKLERKIEVFNMDGRRFIDAIFKSQSSRPITQVVMNLPKDAAEYLDAFKGIFRDADRNEELTLPTIHVYGFSKAEDPEFDFHERIRIALSEVAFEVKMHKVRLVAPGKWMLCASFVLPERVAFADPISEL
ncbi:tRNA (guanine(37)-N1)-methyltransferase 1 isoform X1 [Cynara cardunculus var. scolymus]|uniref:tRNA (guanine(37)-N1)-methyltransferase 1 isoform X1 n=1 Tax=Cynara cardunculus var. scolymus TaxID=59895 RepID=UPI000D6280B5|nr:tRNA (guanine(37)-N1)-methyltransferase 1 isoform X1 [Cynara cardunculus var. scolymus]